jgi:hypothetical protein
MNRSTIQEKKPLLVAVTVTVAIAVLGAAATQFARAAESRANYTIKEVMKATNKGDASIGKRVVQGKGTPEDFARHVEYYASLPLCTPEKGDKTSWQTKSTALLKAALALKAGEPNALAAYKQAANCKACHSAHKPD